MRTPQREPVRFGGISPNRVSCGRDVGPQERHASSHRRMASPQGDAWGTRHKRSPLVVVDVSPDEGNRDASIRALLVKARDRTL